MGSSKRWLALYLGAMVFMTAFGTSRLHLRAVATVNAFIYEGFVGGIAALSELLSINDRRFNQAPDGVLWTNAYQEAVIFRRANRLDMARQNILLAGQIANRFSTDDLRWKETLRERSAIERELGAYDDAESCLRVLLTVQEMEGESLEMAATLNGICSILLQQAVHDDERVGRLLDRAEAIVRRLGGLHHPELATVFHNRAMVYHYRRRFAEAEALYRKALEIRRGVLGDHSFVTAETFGDLGLLYGELGRVTLCVYFVEQAKKVYERSAGAGHPWIAWYAEQLGITYAKHGSFDEAAREFDEALQSRRRTLGNSHPLTIRSERLHAAVLRILKTRRSS